MKLVLLVIVGTVVAVNVVREVVRPMNSALTKIENVLRK